MAAAFASAKSSAQRDLTPCPRCDRRDRRIVSVAIAVIKLRAADGTSQIVSVVIAVTNGAIAHRRQDPCDELDTSSTPSVGLFPLKRSGSFKDWR